MENRKNGRNGEEWENGRMGDGEMREFELEEWGK